MILLSNKFKKMHSEDSNDKLETSKTLIINLSKNVLLTIANFNVLKCTFIVVLLW